MCPSVHCTDIGYCLQDLALHFDIKHIFLFTTTLCEHFFITLKYIICFIKILNLNKELDTEFGLRKSSSSSLGQLTCNESNAFLIIAFFT